MSLTRLRAKFANRYREMQSALRHRRPYVMGGGRPIISFTFDDAPRSACTRGRQILEDYGVRATYYLSMSLMGADYSLGAAFSGTDLDHLVAAGHEIGSHTYGHLDAWNTDAGLFEASIRENQSKLDELYPGLLFRTFSYPINTPHPEIKKKAGTHFVCCRGGGQAFNSRILDLNLLKGYFIDKRNRQDPDRIRAVIDESCARNGWLIFCTHDIEENPSPYGCPAGLFEDLVRYSCKSGAIIRPVHDACEWLGVVGGRGRDRGNRAS